MADGINSIKPNLNVFMGGVNGNMAAAQTEAEEPVFQFGGENTEFVSLNKENSEQAGELEGPEGLPWGTIGKYGLKFLKWAAKEIGQMFLVEGAKKIAGK